MGIFFTPDSFVNSAAFRSRTADLFVALNETKVNGTSSSDTISISGMPIVEDKNPLVIAITARRPPYANSTVITAVNTDAIPKIIHEAERYLATVVSLLADFKLLNRCAQPLVITNVCCST